MGPGIVAETGAGGGVRADSRIGRLEGRLLITVPGERLFAPDRADLSEKARAAVFNLGGVLRTIGNQIGVAGHTDPVLVTGDAYASNWELSSARAISVLRYLMQAGVAPARLAAAGFGEFQPIDPNDSEAALRKNRRIELKLTER